MVQADGGMRELPCGELLADLSDGFKSDDDIVLCCSKISKAGSQPCIAIDLCWRNVHATIIDDRQLQFRIVCIDIGLRRVP